MNESMSIYITHNEYTISNIYIYNINRLTKGISNNLVWNMIKHLNRLANRTAQGVTSDDIAGPMEKHGLGRWIILR